MALGLLVAATAVLYVSKFTMAMQQLPAEEGQIQTNCSDITKATNKPFPDTMSWGNGGLWALYILTLHAVAASWTWHRKTEDWSNINRLGHMNITALVGGCNNKALSRARYGRVQSMAFRVLQKLSRLLCCVRGLCIFLIIVCSQLFCSLAKPDVISSTERINIPCHLGSYMENSSFVHNLTDKAAFCIPNLSGPVGYFGLEFSFTISFTVSIYHQENRRLSKANSNVVFLAFRTAVNPSAMYRDSGYGLVIYPADRFSSGPRTSCKVMASKVSTQTRRAIDGTTILLWVQIDTDPLLNASCVENNYRVVTRCSYTKFGFMSVHVSGDGMQEPVKARTRIHGGGDMQMSMYMGYFLSIRQLLNLENWQMEVQGPDQDNRTYDLYNQGFNWGGNSTYDPVHHYNQGHNWAEILGLVLGLAAAIGVTATVVYLYFNSKYRRWKKEQDRLAKIVQGLPGVPIKIDFTDIKNATKNFHDTKKLGKGGFGAVYRCTLPATSSTAGRAVEVAVKKFMRDVEERRQDDFLDEVSIINRLRHRNIVPLVGWSYNKGVPVLVYEYMTNGCLDQHLFLRDANNRHQRGEGASIWKWDTRYSIVRDVATGLHYVHHEHGPMVLHRDIKTSNIMLDTTFRARLGDFGIACTVAANKSYVTGIAGTFGYIAPEYAMSHKATRQTDIYAFRVLILEVVSGKKSGDVLPDDDHITEWVWRLHREGVLLEAVDESMLTSGDRQKQEEDEVVSIDEAKRLLLLGLACTNPNPSSCPSMLEVLQIINKLAPAPEVPSARPAFVWPPEDWRTRNSVYSTAMSDWERTSTSTMELVQHSQELPSSASTGEEASILYKCIQSEGLCVTTTNSAQSAVATP